jgi:hypothetical protein
MASHARAASVVALSEKNQLIKIDAGSAGGFAKDTPVCVFDSSGKRVACGRVTKVAPSSALVSIPKGISDVKTGMSAKIVGTTQAVAAAQATGGAKYRFKAGLNLGYLMEPATTSYLAWSPYSSGSTSTAPRWVSGESRQLTYTTFLGEGEYALTPNTAISLGARYGMIVDYPEGLYDFTKGDRNPYISVNQSIQSMGGWSDFYFYRMGSKTTALRVAAGLDYHMSTVTVLVKQKDDDADTSVTLAEASSAVSVLSLRVVPELEFLSGPAGFSVKPVAMVPVVALADTFDASFPQSSGKTSTYKADLKEKLGHTKASYAVQLGLNAMVVF